MDGFIARYFVLLQVKTMVLLMVISAIGAIFDYSRWVWAEKNRVRVAISGAVPPDEKDHGAALSLCAINRSRKEIRLVDAGLRLADGSELEFLRPATSFPCMLDASGRCTSTIDSTYMLRAMEYRRHGQILKFRGYVKDDAGSIYESKPFIIKPGAHLRNLEKTRHPSRAAQESRPAALLYKNSLLQFKQQALRVACALAPADWRRTLDEWIAPLLVLAAVIAMGLSVAGMLLGED